MELLVLFCMQIREIEIRKTGNLTRVITASQVCRFDELVC